MTIFGFTITRQKTAVSAMTPADFGLTGAWRRITESFTGAWQRNIVVDIPDVLTAGPVWACVTLIASDIAKVDVKLMELRAGFWEETTNPAYTPVLRKPNHYQNRITFFQSWLVSKLVWGNTYVLKQRDERGVVSALYVLDPSRVHVLVAPDGSVFYQIARDNLAGIEENSITIPAREVIHDMYIALYHPLCGISPIHACGLAAIEGLKIRRNSTTFFDNKAQIDGVLVAPGPISNETAKKLEDHWNAHFAGPENAGKIVALGDGLKFEPLTQTMSARDAELSDQLKNAALEVCAAYHVPAYMVGYGDPPNYNNIEALNAQYYAQCLQVLIEALELCLDEGLGLANDLGIEFDLDGLLRMDQATKMKTATEGVKGGVLAPNEARSQFNRRPLKGGDTVYLQQQDYSLAALDARDRTQPAPSSGSTASPTGSPATGGAKDLPDVAAKLWLLQEVHERLARAA